VTDTAVWFAAPRRAELRPAEVREPRPTEVTIRATCSLVSAGTEMLVYRGNAGPGDLMPPNAEGSFAFPIKYGYQVVGTIEAAGASSGLTAGTRVFARHPHQTRFTTDTPPTWVTPLPDAVTDTEGAFLNLLRVAVTAHLDAPVRVGEVAVVMGQGIIGHLCGRLARRTASRLIVVDPLPLRRELALAYGADAAVAPGEAAAAVDALSEGRGADVTFEASGAAAALQATFRLTAEYGTIAVLSYFGHAPVPLVLAPEFHWKRQRIVSSNAGVQPRWDPARRTQVALGLLAELDVASLVSRRIPFADAPAAYRLVDEAPAEVLGVVLDYP
jgi:2-desacetyl-2-hydroxyethyl bacteriochlorophyllide A dehydrogenase